MYMYIHTHFPYNWHLDKNSNMSGQKVSQGLGSQIQQDDVIHNLLSSFFQHHQKTTFKGCQFQHQKEKHETQTKQVKKLKQILRQNAKDTWILCRKFQSMLTMCRVRVVSEQSSSPDSSSGVSNQQRTGSSPEHLFHLVRHQQTIIIRHMDGS